MRLQLPCAVLSVLCCNKRTQEKKDDYCFVLGISSFSYWNRPRFPLMIMVGDNVSYRKFSQLGKEVCCCCCCCCCLLLLLFVVGCCCVILKRIIASSGVDDNAYNGNDGDEAGDNSDDDVIMCVCI